MKHLRLIFTLFLFYLGLVVSIAQTTNCPVGTDDDGDGICNIDDICAGYDDTFDLDGDGIPYHCDNCIDINQNGICDTNNDPDLFGDQKLYFSKKRGIYETDFLLELISKDPSAQVRYTTNGQAPTPSLGTVYSTPIPITTTSYIRAVAYTNSDTTKVYTHTYIFPEDVINQPNTISGFPSTNYAFDSSIKNDNTYGPKLEEALTQVPTLSLVMELDDLNEMHEGTLEFPASIELIYPNGDKGKQANAGIERAGGSSFNSTKRNMRLSFKSIYGDSKFNFPIFGEDAASDFDQIALRPGFHACMHLGINHNRGGSNDIADQVVRNLQNNIAKEGTSINGSFMHLYINGVYWGVYNPTERGNAAFGESYYGGDKENFDVIKRKEALDGTIDAWNLLNNKVDNQDLSQAINYKDIQEYVEVDQFTEYVLITNFAPHSDDHLNGKNSFVTRDRTKEEGFRFWIWDTEPALGHYWTWNVADIGSYPYNNIFFSLLNNTDYRTLVGDQVECHCFNDGPLTPDETIKEYLEVYNATDIAMLAEAARWVTKAEYTEFVSTKDRIVDTYLPNRTNDFIQLYKDNNLYPSINAVQFSQYGGVVNTGFDLNLTNPNTDGTIYYTIDGSDPRASGGSIASTANVYNGSVSLPIGIIKVKARIKSGNNWSAMCPRTFHVGQDYGQLVINEIHYAATDSIFLNTTTGLMDTISGRNFTFIELKNNAATSITLTGLQFTNGVELIVDTTGIIPPGGFAVFAEDADWFEARYGFAPDAQFSGKIDPDGEKIILADPFGNGIDSTRFYNINPWDEAPFGKGYSLELLHASLDNEEALNWFRSDNIHGTPKAENSRTCSQSAATIVINEINYNSDNINFDPGDWVELYNPNSTSIDLSGWTLYDNGNAFIIPAGTIIAPTDYMVLVEDESTFTAAFPNVVSSKYIGNLGFTLSNRGERVSLFDSNKCLSDYVIYEDNSPWPTAPDGEGATLALRSPDLDNALANSWEAAPLLITSFTYGSPGAVNNCVVGQACDDGNNNTIDDVLDGNCICVGTDIVFQAKLLLEGFYDASSNQMHTKLQEKGLLPLSQPFNRTPWNYAGTESTLTLPSSAVDWILVMSRNANGNITNQAAGFIDQSGNLLNVEGGVGIPLEGAINQYISIHTRSHLAIISSNSFTGNMYDFTTATSQVEGVEQLKLIDGKYMLYAGDYDNTGIINSNDFNKWKIQGAALNQYLHIDGDGNGIINNLDYNFWQNNKSKVGQPNIRY